MKALPDGTCLAELKPPRAGDGPPVTVRVIKYTVHTRPGNGADESSEVFCLVTSLLDIEDYPALDLACCYPDRWGTGPDERKRARCSARWPPPSRHAGDERREPAPRKEAIPPADRRHHAACWPPGLLFAHGSR